MNRTRYVLTALVTAVLAVSTAATLEAQQGSIRGTVTDSTNQAPIQGAQVSIVGTSSRTETNADGQYRITGVSPGSVAVRVQLIGYAPAQTLVAVRPGEEAVVDFTLAAGVAQLEEIVSVGYGTQTRAELLSAVSSVKAERAREPTGRERGCGAAGQGGGRPGDPERRQPRQRSQRAGPRLGLDRRQQRPAVRGRRRPDDRR